MFVVAVLLILQSIQPTIALHQEYSLECCLVQVEHSSNAAAEV
jgi:hypothetical protein